MVEYLEFVKKFLSVRSALFVNIESFGGNKDKVMNYLSDSSNQEKFVYACVNGYKVEEKNFLLKLEIVVMQTALITTQMKKFSLSTLKKNQDTIKHTLQESFLKKLFWLGI